MSARDWWALAVTAALTACAATPSPITAEPRSDATPEPSASVVAPTRLPARIERTEIMRHAKRLASEELAGRSAYSADEVAAASYIVAELEAASIGPYGSRRLHRFVVDGDKHSANVLGAIRCAECADADDYVVLGAHYDHMGRMEDGLYLGAEDNASGVAVVLEVGRVLARRRAELGRSVVLVFFGAEEVGLHGSRRFVADEQIKVGRWSAMVNVDMIGRPLADNAMFALPKSLMGIDEDKTVGVLGTRDRPAFREVVERACRAAGIVAMAPEDLGTVLSKMVDRLAAGRGDNYSFEAVGVPALFFSSGESVDYHRPTDTVDKLRPDIMQDRANAILEVVIGLTQLAAMQP